MRRALAGFAIVGACVGGFLSWTGAVVAGRSSEIWVQDWGVFYAAGRVVLAGNLALLGDAAGFSDFQHVILAPWNATPPTLHPWLYPPHYLLLLVPLALLPFAVGYAVFVLATGAASVAALAWAAGWRGFDWPRGLMVLMFPATILAVLPGQNGPLSAALMIAGLRLLDQRPALAGAVLAALSYKPQFFILIPVALVAARAWRALAACALGLALLTLAAAACFGLESWRLWLDTTLLSSDPARAVWYEDTFLRGYSLYVCATLLGAKTMSAVAIQLAGAVAAAASVAWAWRKPAPIDARIALTLVAAIVASPHVQAYDLVLPAAAAILLYEGDGIGLGVLALDACVWIAPLLRPWVVPSGRLVVPGTLALFLAYAAARCARPAAVRDSAASAHRASLE